MNSVITKIEVQKRDKNRVNIYINEEFAFGCNAELVYTYDLKKGKQVDLEFLKSVVEEDNYLNGKNYSLKVIEKTYKTEKEIRDKLYKKEYGDKVVDRIICFLKEYKFLDDNKYTEAFIKDRMNKYGKNKIKYDLIKKGIDEDSIIEKLYSISCQNEYERAYTLGEGKLKTLIKTEKEVEKNIYKIYKKICDFLIRRGFDYNMVNSVIEQLRNSEILDGYKNLQKDNEKENFNNEQYRIIKGEKNFSKGLDVFTNEESFNEEQDIIIKDEEESYQELKELALKRYKIICKSESDDIKIFRRLSSYLMRRGYSYEEIKKVLSDIV
ncbi:recombination regulator RecX [Haloimpatiens lingqiaonensis]|uniref:recombination regulator RecX n=1 Tax=Haloimpatiens lingqiaonensis TaxID=1380675 RepID=UPI0010FE7D0D|nr:recombination regulator RecX [Haloimpatiens lingqiaonensis]